MPSESDTLVIEKQLQLTGDLTVPLRVTLQFETGGAVDRNGFSLRLSNMPRAPLSTVFTGPGQTIFEETVRGEVYPQWWGFSTEGTGKANATALQAALDASAKRATVFIPGGTYHVAPDTRLLPDQNRFTKNGDMPVAVDVPANSRIILDDEAVLESTPAGSFHCLFWVHEKHNVTVQGGTLVGERATHAARSEWGFGIVLSGGNNIRLEGITARDFQGDGIYIGSGITQGVPSDIIINRVLSFRNYRHGVSIVSGHRITLRDAWVHDNGIGYGSPRPGVDVETEDGDVSDLVVENLTSTNDGVWLQAVSDHSVRNFALLTSTIERAGRDGVRLLRNGNGTTDAIRIHGNRIKAASERGIQCSALSPDSVNIMNNQIELSGLEGILIYACDGAVAMSNTVNASSQSEDDVYSNIKLAVNVRKASVFQNVVRRGAQSRKPRYGIEVNVPGGSGNLIEHNDVQDGGKRANLYLKDGGNEISFETNAEAVSW